jgi:hypothetical protein
MMDEILDLCELCGEPLDADNFYGSDDFPLCRYHYGKFQEMFSILRAPTQIIQAKQLSLLEAAGEK